MSGYIVHRWYRSARAGAGIRYHGQAPHRRTGYNPVSGSCECTYVSAKHSRAGARAHTHTQLQSHAHNHKQIIILHTHRKMMLTEVAQSTSMSSAIWSCCRWASIATQTACPVPSATPTTRCNRLYELASISAFMLSQHLNAHEHMTNMNAHGHMTNMNAHGHLMLSQHMNAHGHLGTHA
jgi:hypothetical protein